jgi:hypothetical protein
MKRLFSTASLAPSEMSTLNKDALLAAIKSDGYAYFPYSSEDVFELCHSETTRYSVFRVPVEFVKSFETFSADSFMAAFGPLEERDIPFIEVSPANEGEIDRHLRWLDTTDEPSSIKFKDIALRGLHGFEMAANIWGRDPCTDLIVVKTRDFYVRLLWFTTG